MASATASALNLGVEVFLGNHGVDPAPCQGLRGAVAPAKKPDLSRALLAEDAS